MTIGGNTVTINTGDITQLAKSFVFNLAAPVTLGKIEQFLDWIGHQTGLDITQAQLEGYGQDIPIPALQTAYLQMLGAQVGVTALNINVPQKSYKFGVSLDFPEGIGLGFLSLDGIGVLVQNNGTGGGSP
ncbi:hypothetical protein DBR42_25020 [Pelomonas sp. HMWF004]|nr:hypothetical protein DBR42_25020 [Pelomonas sp. HMWF004]